MSSKDSYRFVNQSMVSLVRACSGLIWASAGPLLPLIMQEYGINRGTVSWFASTAPISIAILAVPISIIGAKYSPKKLFAFGAVMQAAGILALFINNYPLLLVTRMLYAVGSSISFTLSTTIAAEWFSSRELPLVNGVTMSLVSVGNVVAFAATVPIANALSWRAPIAIYGGVALTCALGWIIFGKDHQSIRTISTMAETTTPEKRPELTLRQVFTRRSTILLAFAALGCWCLGNALGSWLPSYYHEVFKMPLEKASLITALLTAGGILAAILGGILSVRVGRRKPFLIIPGALMGVTALCSVLFNNPVVIFISVACFGFISTLHMPALFTIPMELPDLSPRTGATVIFVMLVGGNLGNFVGPIIVGYLADTTGSYLPGFIICMAISLALLIAGVMLPETGPKARKLELKHAR